MTNTQRICRIEGCERVGKPSGGGKRAGLCREHYGTPTQYCICKNPVPCSAVPKHKDEGVCHGCGLDLSVNDALQTLIGEVYDGVYGTKNRAQLIQKLYALTIT